MLLVHLEIDGEVSQGWESVHNQLLREVAHVNFAMVPIIAQTSEMILMTVAQKVAIARLVLLPILKVVNSDIRISYVTHLWSIVVSSVFVFFFFNYFSCLEKWAQFISSSLKFIPGLILN